MIGPATTTVIRSWRGVLAGSSRRAGTSVKDGTPKDLARFAITTCVTEGSSGPRTRFHHDPGHRFDRWQWRLADRGFSARIKESG